MHRFHGPIHNTLCGLILLGAVGVNAYANTGDIVPELSNLSYEQSCVNDLSLVVPGDKKVYGVFNSEKNGTYLIKRGTNLGVIVKDYIENGDSAKLKNAWKTTLPSREVIHTLVDNLDVQAEDGQKYTLRKNTVVKLILSNVEGVEIPKDTRLTKVAGKDQEFILSEDLELKIPTPKNYRATLYVETQVADWIIPKVSGMGATFEFEPQRAPQNEYIILTVKKSGFDFSKAQFYVCLKKLNSMDNEYLPSNNLELITIQAGKAILKAKIPDLKNDSKYSAIPVNLLVVAAMLDGNITSVKSQEFVVSSRSAAVMWWMAAFLLPWVIGGIVKGPKTTGQPARFSPIWFVAGKYGSASLSLAQILLWTVLVFSASFYVWAISGKLLDLTNDVLILLGIAGGSSVIAKITASSKDGLARGLTDPQTKNPTWLDLFQSEGRPDLYKVQMALFTTLAAIFVVGKIYVNLEFPKLPDGLLTLIGISNGVYLGAKASSKTVYEKLAEAFNEFLKAQDDLEKRTTKADETKKILDTAEKELATAILARDKTKGKLDKAPESEKEKLKQLLQQQETSVKEIEKRVTEASKKNEEANVEKSAAQEKYVELKKEFDQKKKEVSVSPN